MPSDDSIFVKCNCHGHAIELNLWLDEEHPQLSDLTLGFWYMGKHDKGSFFERMKKLFKYFIQGRTVWLEDIILSPKATRELGHKLVSMATQMDGQGKGRRDKK